MPLRPAGRRGGASVGGSAGPRSPAEAARLWRLLPLLTALLAPLLPPPGARAEASLAQCQRWQQSNGVERILLGNSIGAAAYLTKVHRFAESDPEHPQLLYAPADLQRACQAWR